MTSKKRWFLLCLALVLALSCGVNAFAARPASRPGEAIAVPEAAPLPGEGAGEGEPAESTQQSTSSKPKVVIENTRRTKPLTSFERKIVEQGFRLLPYDHPFVVAYERTYKTRIKSFRTQINGVEVSGVPFQFGGSGSFKDFSSSWWERTGQSYYPIKGLDCAGFISWIYNQLDIKVPNGSAGLFFGGKAGVRREISGLRSHLVIPTLDEALIGDIFYNSQKGNYQSGDGSHVQMYLGTAKILGIAAALQEMMPEFPVDAHLVLDCGWSDGPYYYQLMKKLEVPKPRQGMGGVGVQFMTSMKSGDTVLYECPEKVWKWKNMDTLNTFRIESRLEGQGRLLQYNPDVYTEHPMNLVRPLNRPDA